MKICYSNERSTNAWLARAAGIALLILGLVSSVRWPYAWDQRVGMPKFGTLRWFLSALPVVLMAVYIFFGSYVLDREARNHRNWHKHLTHNGIKCRGRVEEVLITKSFGSGGRSRTLYRFRVSYYSPLAGEEKELITPYLTFRPDPKKKWICDVYEMAGSPEETESEGSYRSGASYHMTLNPFKLWKTILEKSGRTWFGNAVAENFCPIPSNTTPGGKE